MYDKLVAKVNNFDTSGFVLKTKYNTDKSYLEKKIRDADKEIPNISEVIRKVDNNTKINEIENKLPSTAGLATNAALTAVENKIPDVSILSKKKIIMQKYQTLKINILLLRLITIRLLKILLLITQTVKI